MKVETAGHVIEGHIIVGRITQVFIGDRNGMSRLVITDEYDKKTKHVLVHTKLFGSLVSLEQTRNALKNARVILACRSYAIELGAEKIQDVFELINVLDGQLAGHMLVYQMKPERP